MSFFNFLGKVASNVHKSVEQKQREYQNEVRNVNGSAIPPGRMRETDIFKGKDCSLPTEPGVYRHRNKETGEIDYVGQTNNVRKRQQEHARAGRLNSETHYVQYGRAEDGASKDSLLQTEKDHISRHKPKGNKTGGGNGRR